MSVIHLYHDNFAEHSSRHPGLIGMTAAQASTMSGVFPKKPHGAGAGGFRLQAQTVSRAGGRGPLRLGFVPLTDCVPLVMAHELGLFAKYGVRVALSRELGWASIRDKVIHGELDAAHAVAGMPVAATLGLGSIQCDCVAAMVLNLHGNAITLSSELWDAGVRDGLTLKQEMLRLKGRKKFTFGVVYPFSSHHFLLRSWMTRAGIAPDRDARVVVVPPPQMVANLKAGHLDGFCVGEPWNSVAVQAGAGWCVGASAELEPNHPEKVLMVRRDFAESRSPEHLGLLSGLLEACEFCDALENHERIIATLARPAYVGVSRLALQAGLCGPFDFGHGQVRRVGDFNVFHRGEANEPTDDKTAWVLRHLRESGLCPAPSAVSLALGRRIFRRDLFEEALRLRQKGLPLDSGARAVASGSGSASKSSAHGLCAVAG